MLERVIDAVVDHGWLAIGRDAPQETRMNPPGTDTAFVTSIPQFYDRYMVPLIFEPYAADLALRTARRHPSRVLEIAAGTGVVTRHLAKMLPPGVSIVAT